MPEVNSALVSINPQTVPLWRWSVALISIRASLTAHPGTASGGFQHQTVPLHRGEDKGLTLASMLNDVPISRWDEVPVLTGSRRTHHRSMLVQFLTSGAGSVEKRGDGTRNAGEGVDYAAEYLQRFGFPAQNIATPNRWRWVQRPSPQCRWRALRGHGERWLPGGPVVYQQN